MIRAEDDPSLSQVIMTMARYAGVTADEATAMRLTPVLASLLADWERLTQAVAPETEPMSVGRWPEGSDEVG